MHEGGCRAADPADRDLMSFEMALACDEGRKWMDVVSGCIMLGDLTAEDVRTYSV